MELKIDFDPSGLMRGFVDIEKANVEASKNTLNTMAFLSRKNALQNIRQDFINRNNFTERQIQVQKAEGLSLSSLAAHVGATERAGYMELQETGGTREPSGSGDRVAIPSRRARGGNSSKPVERSNYLRLVKSRSVRGPMTRKLQSRKARLVARAAIAYKEKKFLIMGSGIYIVETFNDPTDFRMTRIYDTSQAKTNVPSTPWLEPAIGPPIGDAQNIYNSQIRKLLRMKEII